MSPGDVRGARGRVMRQVFFGRWPFALAGTGFMGRKIIHHGGHGEELLDRHG